MTTTLQGDGSGVSTPPDLRECAVQRSVALQRGSLVQDALGVAGATIKVTTAKNKVAPSLRKAELTLCVRSRSRA
jgi:hypothetical protein